MDIGIVSMRYAKALMAYARSTDTEDTLYKECSTLAQSFASHPELRTALANPIASSEDKFKLICIATSGAVSPSKEFQRFIQLIQKNRRENLLQYISLSYMSLYRNRKHIGVARLITAVPVSKEVEARIQKTSSSVLHANMELHTEVNPEIEGGFIFDINDYRLDASVATQLKRVKQQFIDKNRRIV